MSVGVVDCRSGNIGSLTSAVYHLGFDPYIIKNAEDFDEVEHLIIPGVGSFKSAMSVLIEENLTGPICEFAKSGKPVLGICLGMHLLLEQGEEGGISEGLGLIPGIVQSNERLNSKTIMHIGWNNSEQIKPHPIFEGINSGVDFYFVHGFHCKSDNKFVLSETNFGSNFCSVIGSKNVIGAQFHPEKSQANGLKFLENFCGWDGKC